MKGAQELMERKVNKAQLKNIKQMTSFVGKSPKTSQNHTKATSMLGE